MREQRGINDEMRVEPPTQPRNEEQQPCELRDNELKSHFIQRMSERFPGGLIPDPEGKTRPFKIGPLPRNMGNGVWTFPYSWTAPLHWYATNLEFPSGPSDSDPGITWVEMVIDFEISTRVQLLGNGQRITSKMTDPKSTSVAQRANHLMHALKRLV